MFELFSSAAPKAAGSGNAITLLPDLAWIGQERNGTARREAVGQLCGFSPEVTPTVERSHRR